MFSRVVVRDCSTIGCKESFQMNEINGKRPREVWCKECTTKRIEAERQEALDKKLETLGKLEELTIEERIKLIEEELYDVRISKSKNVGKPKPYPQVIGSRN